MQQGYEYCYKSLDLPFVHSPVAKDPVITWKEKQELERKLNGFSLQLGRALKAGETWKHRPRIKTALKNEPCHIPILYGLMKDHKEVGEDQNIPTQPVWS